MMFKKTLSRAIVTLSILIFSLGYSCSDNFEKTRPLAYTCLDETLLSMETALNEASIGEEDGMYPQDAADKLSAAISDLKIGISKRNGDMFVLQHEVDKYCSNASVSLATFQDSKQITLLPGEAGELFVNGIDKKSYIDFGASPEYGKYTSFTVEAWLKHNKNAYDNAIADFIATFTKTSEIYQGWMINFMGDKLRMSMGMGPQQDRVLEGAGESKIFDKWMHIVAIYDQSGSSNQLRMYIDGELFFSKSNDVVDGSGTLQLYQAPADYRMWAFQQPSDVNRCMSGYIKKFRLWKSAKTEGQIKELMNADVTGTETDLICAWDFNTVPTDNQNMKDKTGRHTAKIVGNHSWKPIK